MLQHIQYTHTAVGHCAICSRPLRTVFPILCNLWCVTVWNLGIQEVSIYFNSCSDVTFTDFINEMVDIVFSGHEPLIRYTTKQCYV
jgi:hypothetical protein